MDYVLFSILLCSRKGLVNLCVQVYISDLFQVEADAQHLFFGRRASARIRVQLMNAIHAKSLNRPLFQGAVEETAKTTGERVADPGKIVNMVVGDVNTVSAIVASAYLLYGSESVRISMRVVS